MLSHRGMCHTNWYQDQKNLMCGISRSPTQDTSGTSYKWYLQVVSFQQSMRSSMRSSPFLEINDKGGEIVQRYESFEIESVQGER